MEKQPFAECRVSHAGLVLLNRRGGSPGRRRIVWAGYSLLLVVFIFACGRDEPAEPAAFPGIVMAKSGLVLRDAPATTAAKLDLMPHGSELLVMDTNGPAALLSGWYDNWYRVRYGTNTGWAFGGFIEKLGIEYRPIDVRLTNLGLMALARDMNGACFETDKGGFPIPGNYFHGIEIVDQSQWSRFSGFLWPHFGREGNDPVPFTLLLAGESTVVGAILPSGQRFSMKYFYKKSRRFREQDCRTVKVVLERFIVDQFSFSLISAQGLFWMPFDMEFRPYSRDVFMFIKDSCEYRTNFEAYPRIRSMQVIVKYLPAENVQLYNLKAEDLPAYSMSEFKGILLAVDDGESAPPVGE